MKTRYELSFRCYFAPGDYTQHYQTMPLKDIEKWVKAYRFTHPNVQSITVKIWVKEGQA